MPNFLGSDWDRGYRAGRQAGLDEMRGDMIKAVYHHADAAEITLTQRCNLVNLLEDETSWVPKPASLKNIAFDTGVLAERERIIKVLQEANPEHFGCPHWQEHSTIEVSYLIALIKGEK